MARSFVQIQQALDAQLVTVAGITATGSSANLVTENKVGNLAMLPDITSKIYVRTTVIPFKTTVETLGVGGFVYDNGIYAIDVFGAVNTSYVGAKTLADLILAAFPPGLQLTLTNGNVITIETSTPSPNITQGAWTMGKLYCTQVLVYWFAYLTP